MLGSRLLCAGLLATAIAALAAAPAAAEDGLYFSAAKDSPVLAVDAKRGAVSSAGIASVPVACTGGSAYVLCAGAMSLTTAERLVIKVAGRSRAIQAGTAIGSGTVAVAAGGRATAAITLNTTGRRIASSSASIPARVAFAPTGGTALAGAITLTAARAPALVPRSTSGKAIAGRVPVSLRCAAAPGAVCRGTLRLTARLSRRTATIGHYMVSLHGGRTALVSVKLTAPALALLARGPLAARQVAESTVPVGLATLRGSALRLTL